MSRSPRLSAVIALGLIFGLAGASWSESKLRDELITRQKAGGYVLEDFGRGSVYTADFTRQSEFLESQKLPLLATKADHGLLSPDGDWIALTLSDYSGTPRYSLGMIRRDGSGFHEYTEASRGICWSPDSKQLITAQPEGSPHQGRLLDVESGRFQELELPRRAALTSQCWSPDGKRLVYHVLDHEPAPWTDDNPKKKEPPNPGTIFIYDLVEKKHYPLGPGQEPTWSPDGEWIAYWNNGAYYRIRPSGGSPQRLFKSKESESALLWSPDSRLVLRFHCCYLMPSLRCMCDVGRWFVQRVADHSEIRVAEGSPSVPTLVWVKRTR